MATDATPQIQVHKCMPAPCGRRQPARASETHSVYNNLHDVDCLHDVDSYTRYALRLHSQTQIRIFWSWIDGRLAHDESLCANLLSIHHKNIHICVWLESICANILSIHDTNIQICEAPLREAASCLFVWAPKCWNCWQSYNCLAGVQLTQEHLRTLTRGALPWHSAWRIRMLGIRSRSSVVGTVQHIYTRTQQHLGDTSLRS